ncbi:MAG TPA: tryptophan synthase subunit alpha [Syntrophobacteraceae bacterium]|nr:tryptophan synthase subunit alpha [Syntrophobacteraceae bacterium]
MSRIEETFGRLRAKGEKALVGFITAGDPDPVRSLEIARQMCRSGLDLLELGVPFSDPTADGPVIQRSSSRAIGAGTNMRSVMEMVRRIREFCEIPLVLFSYYNPILAYGAEKFYRDATSAGADGTLVVDLPPEESDELTGVWGNGLDFIRLVAPTTPPERMARIASKASGFIYLVSMTGTTGSGGLNREEIAPAARDLKERCLGLPICIGFGISTPDDAAKVRDLADGIVVGSAFERLIESNLEDEDLAGRVGAYAARLKEAILR